MSKRNPKKLLSSWWLVPGALVIYFYFTKPAPYALPSLPQNNLITGKSVEKGIASWYGPGYEGNLTANGETFNSGEMTAAHKTLKFNTRVKVTDLDTGNSVVVRINDRGPYVKGRIIDLSKEAARRLGMLQKGLANVEVEIL